jgi:hypothetical protein
LNQEVAGTNETVHCANCEAPVAGKYCATCGQRVIPGLPTVSHLVEEAAEMLSHADSRLWRTLIPLVTRPGYLTLQYIQGHRAKFLPPLRLYLVISVIFFLVMGLNSGAKIALVNVQRVDEPKITVLIPVRPVQSAPSAQSEQATPPGHETCNDINLDMPGKAWLEPRARKACARALEDGGAQLGNQLLHNLGRAMFVFLPVIAALMSLLYLRPRRLYVEHLLLLVHNHAATFLLLSIAHLLSISLPWDGLASAVSALAGGYLLYYNFRSLRVVYGQGRAITLAKFAVLAIVYWAGAALMLVVVSLMSVLAG